MLYCNMLHPKCLTFKPLTRLFGKFMSFEFDEKCAYAFRILKNFQYTAPDQVLLFKEAIMREDYLIGHQIDKKIHNIQLSTRQYVDNVQVNQAMPKLLDVIFNFQNYISWQKFCFQNYLLIFIYIYSQISHSTFKLLLFKKKFYYEL